MGNALPRQADCSVRTGKTPLRVDIGAEQCPWPAPHPSRSSGPSDRLRQAPARRERAAGWSSSSPSIRPSSISSAGQAFAELLDQRGMAQQRRHDVADRVAGQRLGRLAGGNTDSSGIAAPAPAPPGAELTEDTLAEVVPVLVAAPGGRRSGRPDVRWPVRGRRRAPAYRTASPRSASARSGRRDRAGSPGRLRLPSTPCSASRLSGSCPAGMRHELKGASGLQQRQCPLGRPVRRALARLVAIEDRGPVPAPCARARADGSPSARCPEARRTSA